MSVRSLEFNLIVEPQVRRLNQPQQSDIRTTLIKEFINLMTTSPFKAQALTGTEITVHSENLLAPLASASRSSRTLPYFHSCSGKAFRSILASGKIEKRNCPVFDEDLIYLFYGKPSYRISGNNTNTRDTGRFPVCFVLTDLDDTSIKRVFPFDTGALAFGIYKDVCGDELNPCCFEIGSERSSISSLIDFLYTDDANYFHARPQISIDNIDALCFELRQIFSFITHYGGSNWDSRAHSIEVQQDQEILLSHAPIEAIILPDSYMNNPRVADFMYNNGITPINYSIQHSNPSSATEVLYELARKYLVDKGLV